MPQHECVAEEQGEIRCCKESKRHKMNEDLSKHGLFFDYLYNLRVLDPNIAGETTDLKEKSGEYTESMCAWYPVPHVHYES